MTEIVLIKFEGKPLEKLIEVISQGIGTLYRPTAIRKEAEAEAYKMEVVAESEAYKIQIVESAKSTALAESKEIEAAMLQRIQQRLLHQETKRQQSIDNVTGVAAEELQGDTTISDEPVDPNWTSRFFNIVADISDEETQRIWGKILAGEVKEPKSYSLRTLELLKNLSKEEAELFTRFARISLGSSGKHFVFDPDSGKFLKDHFNIHFTDRLLLVEAGLLAAENNLRLTFEPVTTLENVNTIALSYGKKGFFIKRNLDTPIQTLSIIVFSKAGVELLKLIEPMYDEEYINKISAAFKHEKTATFFGDFQDLPNGEVMLYNEVEL